MSQTLNQMFHNTASRLAGRPALRFREGEIWRDLTWSEVEETGVKAANALLADGVNKGDRVGVLSNTRPEWLLGDLGSVLSGAATVTLYQSNTADECAYIISNSELCVVFAEDEEQLAKLQSIKDQILQCGESFCLTVKVMVTGRSTSRLFSSRVRPTLNRTHQPLRREKPRSEKTICVA